MKRKNLTTALLLAAFAMPALAQNEPEAQPNEPAQAQLERQIQRALADIQTSRAMTKEERERFRIDPEELLLILQAGPNGGVQEQNRLLAPAPEPVPMVRTAFLGVTAEPLDLQIGKALGLKAGTGLKVTYVASSGPAWDAGLRKGAVLTRLDDQILVNAEQFAVLVRTHKAGDTVKLHGLRDGKAMQLEAKLGEADSRQLGPGGSDLHQEWSLQFSPRGGPVGSPLKPGVEIAPGVWVGDGWSKPPPHGANDQPLPEDVRAMFEQIKRQMRQQREDVDRQMRELRLELDLDPEKLREQGDGAPGVVRMQSAIVQFDGEHRIEIKNRDGVAYVNITDKKGKELYDGPLPADGVIEGLPADVRLKLQNLLIKPSKP